MGALIHVVMFAAALLAFIAWSLAALAALGVASLAPKGEKLSAYFDLGMWHFASLEARFGAGVTPHLVRYRRAFFAFFAVIGAILALSFSFLFLKNA
jgi:hypothetical protein